MKLRLYQRLQMHLDDHLRHAIADRGIPNGLSLPSCLGMYTRRTGWGQYVSFSSSSANSSSHRSLPYVSISAKLWPSLPGTPVGPAAFVGEAQDVAAIDLVVEGVEAVVGRVLRFGVQRRLERPNLQWR